MVALCFVIAAASFILPSSTTLRTSGTATTLAPRAARAFMQVDAPVKPKIPDRVPQLAPTKPSSDKDNEKAKKYKVLLFNDNINRCVDNRRPSTINARTQAHDLDVPEDRSRSPHPNTRCISMLCLQA